MNRPPKLFLKAAAAVALIAVLAPAAGGDPAVPVHQAVSSLLLDAARVQSVKQKLTSSWQIIGMNDPLGNIQANLVGGGLIAAAKGCGLAMLWDKVGHADHYVWPVVLSTPSPEAIDKSLAALWASAGLPTPTDTSALSNSAYNHLQKWGLGEVVLTLQSGQEFNFVFIDGREFDESNNLAALDYSIASTVAGFDLPDGASLEDDYTYLGSTGGALSVIAGNNKSRFGRLCRLFAIENSICNDSLTGLTEEKVGTYLDALDARCANNGEAVSVIKHAEELLLRARASVPFPQT